MKSVRIAVIAVFAFFLAASLGPAGAAEPKIGYVNLQKALNGCQAGIKATEDLKVEAEGLKSQFNKKQEELKKMKEDLDSKSKVWNKETREAKEKDLMAKAADFQNKFMDYNEELNKKERDSIARIIKELLDVVEEIAQKKGLTFVFDKSGGSIIYAPKELDLTDEVIKAYDAKKKKK